jgi:hypothetical protein
VRRGKGLAEAKRRLSDAPSFFFELLHAGPKLVGANEPEAEASHTASLKLSAAED